MSETAAVFETATAKPATPASSHRPARQRKIIAADLFCGSGGFSTGAKRASDSLGANLSLTCINHWQTAINSHTLNHPYARHYCQDLGTIRPIAAVPEGYLDLLMASPTCTHFSRARGGKPTSDQQRMDPWHVITWLTELRVKRLAIENVREIMDWGPVHAHTGKPLKSRKGEYFNAWINTIRGLGFKIDYRVLNCADYGDATTRERFFLLGRSDGKPIRWPEPTHSRQGDSDLFGNGGQPWRTAHQIIDWNTPGVSIYTRKRPLSPKTLLRIFSGIVRHDWSAAHINRLRTYMLDRDIPPETIADTETKALRLRNQSRPARAMTIGQGSCAVTRPTNEPISTILAAGAIGLITTPSDTPSDTLIAPYYGSGSGETCTTTHIPLPTLTTKSRLALVEPRPLLDCQGMIIPLTHTSNNMPGRSIALPLPTITTAKGGEHAFIHPASCDASDPDILFRMLTVRELSRATSLDTDTHQYLLDGSIADQVKQIGNAVPAGTSEALTKALLSY